mmetsp:Transcript_28751/g.63582  ORF Transcript_28751/g.63582 Transcript_28751/m.63582 type:complete len:311 (-) Transcript_28751:56-988(-)
MSHRHCFAFLLCSVGCREDSRNRGLLGTALDVHWQLGLLVHADLLLNILQCDHLQSKCATISTAWVNDGSLFPDGLLAVLNQFLRFSLDILVFLFCVRSCHFLAAERFPILAVLVARVLGREHAPCLAVIIAAHFSLCSFVLHDDGLNLLRHLFFGNAGASGPSGECPHWHHDVLVVFLVICYFRVEALDLWRYRLADRRGHLMHTGCLGFQLTSFSATRDGGLWVAPSSHASLAHLESALLVDLFTHLLVGDVICLHERVVQAHAHTWATCLKRGDILFLFKLYPCTDSHRCLHEQAQQKCAAHGFHDP